MLYIVATPIGNLQDISARAIEVLKEVDLIAAEDTRHSQRLMEHYAIDTPLTSLHEHNERAKNTQLVEQLLKGKTIALISDAGTPLISDPGYQFVKAAREAKIQVCPVPGASACIAALSASGLPSDRFSFHGFLAAKTVARKKYLTACLDAEETLIFYESPHRIVACLEDMQSVFGDERFVVIARELTKTYETIHGDTLGRLVDWVKADSNQQRGEFVLLVKTAGEEKQIRMFKQAFSTYQLLSKELPMKQAVKLAAELTSTKKNELYRYVLDAENE